MNLNGQIPDGKISRVAFGTADLRDDAARRRLLDHAYDCGCRVFDTARCYRGGESERTLGQWLRSRRLYDEVTVVTKCGHPSDRSRLTYADLLADVDQSRAALGIDRLGLVLLHRDDPTIPAGEIIDALNQLQQAGKLQAIGVSNWSVTRILAAQEYAHASGLAGFCASSVHLSLASWARVPWPGCRSVAGVAAEKERTWYAATQFPLMAWAPLAAGFFRIDPAGDNGHINNSSVSPHALYTYLSKENIERRTRLHKLAQGKGITTAQLALGFVLNQPMNLCAILGTSKESHFREAWDAIELRLERSEMQWLNLETNELPYDL